MKWASEASLVQLPPLWLRSEKAHPIWGAAGDTRQGELLPRLPGRERGATGDQWAAAWITPDEWICPGHKGKRLLFTEKYSGYLATSNDRKGNAEKAEGSSGPRSWPALTHHDLKQSLFYSCSSVCGAEGSPALHRSHGYLENSLSSLQQWGKSKPSGFLVDFLLIGQLTSALGRHMAFLFPFGERPMASSKVSVHTFPVHGGIWMAPGSLCPQESNSPFPSEVNSSQSTSSFKPQLLPRCLFDILSVSCGQKNHVHLLLLDPISLSARSKEQVMRGRLDSV